MEKTKYIVTLGNKIFKNGEEFFSLRTAKDFVKRCEKIFTPNKCKYMIMRLTQINQNKDDE